MAWGKERVRTGFGPTWGEMIGDKKLLEETTSIAKQIEGTQPRVEELPS